MSTFNAEAWENRKWELRIESRAKDKIDKGLKAAADCAFAALNYESSDEAVERAFLIRAEYVRYINGKDFKSLLDAVRNRSW